MFEDQRLKNTSEEHTNTHCVKAENATSEKSAFVAYGLKEVVLISKHLLAGFRMIHGLRGDHSNANIEKLSIIVKL